MNMKFRNILRGAGSILDIFPAREDVSIKTVRESKEGALARDLRQVTNDFTTVIGRFVPIVEQEEKRVCIRLFPDVIGGAVRPGTAPDRGKKIKGAVKTKVEKANRRDAQPSPAKGVLVCSNGKGIVVLGKGANITCTKILASEDEVFCSTEKQKKHTGKLKHA